MINVLFLSSSPDFAVFLLVGCALGSRQDQKQKAFFCCCFVDLFSVHIDCFSLSSNLSTVLAHSSVLLDPISHYSNIFKYTNFLGIKHTPRVSLNQFVMLTVILTESRVIWETGLWPHTCRDYFEVGRKTLPLWVAPLPGWGPGLCK